MLDGRPFSAETSLTLPQRIGKRSNDHTSRNNGKHRPTLKGTMPLFAKPPVQRRRRSYVEAESSHCSHVRVRPLLYV